MRLPSFRKKPSDPEGGYAADEVAQEIAPLEGVAEHQFRKDVIGPAQTLDQAHSLCDLHQASEQERTYRQWQRADGPNGPDREEDQDHDQYISQIRANEAVPDEQRDQDLEGQ